MSVTVTLGMTMWNLLDVAALPLGAIRHEASRLTQVGFRSSLYVVDNASTDGTQPALRHMDGLDLIALARPAGASVLRNLIVDGALLEGSTYTVFVDGDIAVIPHSLVAGIRYLEEHPELDALAFDPTKQSRDYATCSTHCHSVKETTADPLMYLCGYGIFRTSVWNRVRFDELGPMAEPGWGSEDDDLWLQMREQDLTALYASGFTYFHARPRSSWDSLRHLGLDPVEVHQARREYLFAKWRDLRSEKAAPLLNLLKGQHVA